MGKEHTLKEEELRSVVSANLGDRSKTKSTKEVLDELSTKSFSEEVEQDKDAMAAVIRRGERAKGLLKSQRTWQKNGVFDDQHEGMDLPLEKAGSDILKRTLLLMGSSELQLKNGEAKKSASENNLPVATYLSHGSRVLITIPACDNTEPDALMNWITTGDVSKSGLSSHQTQAEAIKEGKFVYNRSAATHDVSFDKNGKAKELKGFMIGVRDFFSNKLLGKKTKHFGIDLALGAEFDGQDLEGNIVSRPDGDHGHLYFHYTPPTKDKPGTLLLGVEASAPSSHKHSKTGASDPISAAGGSIWADLANKFKFGKIGRYQDTMLPQKYNGISVDLRQKTDLDKLMQTNADDYGEELAAAMPKKSLEDFNNGMKTV